MIVSISEAELILLELESMEDILADLLKELEVTYA